LSREKLSSETLEDRIKKMAALLMKKWEAQHFTMDVSKPMVYYIQNTVSFFYW
jgi:hypothetical protein